MRLGVTSYGELLVRLFDVIEATLDVASLEADLEATGQDAGHLATAERAAGVDVASPIALEDAELGSDVEVVLAGVAVVVVEVVAGGVDLPAGGVHLEPDDEGSHLQKAHRRRRAGRGGGDDCAENGKGAWRGEVSGSGWNSVVGVT